MSLTAKILSRTVITLALVLLVAVAAQAAKVSPALETQLAQLGPADLAEVVVTFNTDSISPSQVAAVKALGVTQGFTFRALPIMGVLATRAQVSALAARSDVRSVWDNTQLKWFNAEARALTGVDRLRTDPVLIARNKGFPYSGNGVGVVINDSGIDATHSDLMYGERVKQNAQGATNLHAYSDLLPITYLENQPLTDTAGHGTHVAGTVGGNGLRSAGKYAGVAPGADLVGYGSGAVILVLDALGGLDYALVNQIEHRVRVINNSWGTDTYVFDPDDPVNVATKRLHDHGIVVVFAAGNSGPGAGTISHYSQAPWVICVGNTYKNGTLNESSSRGIAGDNKTITVDGESWTVENRPTVSAPGTFIISTRAVTNNNTLIAGQAGPQEDANRIEPAFLPFYTVLTGTSMASPHVAGIVALILEANPSLSPDQVKDILQKTATNLPGYEAWEAGAGIVNAYAAVDRAVRTANYGTTVNMTRRFNSQTRFNTQQTDFTIEYTTAPEASPTQNRFPFPVPNGTALLEARVDVFGLLGVTGNTINLVLIAPDGSETSSGVYVLFPIYTDRVVIVTDPMPGNWVVELRGLRGDPANPTDGVSLPETVQGYVKQSSIVAYSGLDDIANRPEKSYILAAVHERLVDGENDRRFRPTEKLTRMEMASFLTMGNAIRQYFPTNGTKTFSDVINYVPFAEAVAARGAALRDLAQKARGVMLPKAPGLFAPSEGVRRVDLAYALVQSLGLEADALARNGQTPTVQYGDQRIPIDDAAKIPAAMEGYVQLALDLNIMNAFFSLTQGPYDLQPTIHATFKPTAAVTRAAYAVDAVRFYHSYFAP